MSQMIGRRYLDPAGLDLVCVCEPTQPCHADVLLRVANTEQETTR